MLWRFVVVFCLAAQVYGVPYDLGRFLEDRFVGTYPTEDGFYLSEKSRTTENYIVLDENGNAYVLSIPQHRSELIDRIVFSQLTSVLDMPSVLAYPVVFSRDALDLPSEEEAQKRFPTIFKAEGNKWIAGVVEQMWPAEFAKNYVRGQSLNGRQLLSYLKMFLLQYVLGCASYTTPLVLEDTILAQEVKSLYSYLRPQFTKNVTLKQYIQAFNLEYKGAFPGELLRDYLTRLSREQRNTELEEWVRDLNTFLSRLKGLLNTPNVSDSWLAQLLVPSIMVQQEQVAQPTQLLERMAKKINQLSEEVSQLLSSNGLNRQRYPVQTHSIDMNPHFVDLNAYMVRKATQVEFSETWFYRAKDYLLRYWVSEPTMKRALVNAWSEKLSQDDPVLMISQLATEIDNHLYLVSASRLKSSTEIAKVPQWYVNRGVRKTLVVAAPNDAEGRAIVRLVEAARNHRKEVGAEAVELYPNLSLLRQGQGLTETEFQNVLTYAEQNQVKLIVLCEMGFAPAHWFKKAKEKQIILHPLDHHNEFVNKLSTLEQLANLFGLQLNFDDLITAFIDKGGLTGLRNIPFMTEELRTYLERTRQLSEIETFLNQYQPLLLGADQKVDKKALIRIRTQDSRLSQVSKPLAYLFYPDLPHILVEEELRIRFLGDHPTAQALASETLQDSAQLWVTGGDRNSGFAVYKAESSQLGRLKGRVDRLESYLLRRNNYSCVRLIEIEGQD